jgi:signal transduction histidine kinase
MFSRNKSLSILVLVFVIMVPADTSWARMAVNFREVLTTYHAGTEEDLKRTIDGLEGSPKGWSVEPKFGETHTAIFVAEKPIEADLLNLTMFFMSGRPHASFASFSVRFTTDAQPGFESEWHDLPILNCGATAFDLYLDKGKVLLTKEVSLAVTGNFPDNLYWITARTRGKSVTGFRIDVFPSFRKKSQNPEPLMSWASDKDFVLTEFRAEALTTTTNVALGASVTASHPLFVGMVPMVPESLTDGWSSTIAHPAEDVPGKDFYFEIDLGEVRLLDHLLMRQRGDTYELGRFAKMRIRLYDEDPKGGAAPIWQVLHRADGSYPAQGEADLLRALDGQGVFRGRYLRISTENPLPSSPMLAELEAYETRTAKLVSLNADGRLLPDGEGVRVPPGTQRLKFQWEIPGSGRPLNVLYRWKVAEENVDWQVAESLQLEIPCPPPGDFQMIIQAAHSDGTWDASVMRLPFTVEAHFTQTAAFLWLIGGGALSVGALASRYFARRKIARMEAKSALTTERSRIASNIHDDVGARLAQLAVLQDVFGSEHSMSPSAKADLATLTASIREAMVSLDEAVWSVNPRNDTLGSLTAFLMQHADYYLTPLGIACRIDGPNMWPEITLRAGIRHEVALAFKEALQNIIKHAAASEVELTLRHEVGRFIILLADNGCGISEKNSRPGEDGLLNMRQRLESIGGTCKWLPRQNGGTLVEMKFPLS